MSTRTSKKACISLLLSAYYYVVKLLLRAFILLGLYKNENDNDKTRPSMREQAHLSRKM